MSVVEHVRDLVEPLVAETGLELFDVEQAGGVLRVTVDSPDGVDMERLAAVTKVVSRTLDEHDPVPGRYTLEVTSPGLERKLRTPEHYRRSVGSDVSIKLMPGTGDVRRLTGVVVGADDDAVVVAVDGEDRRIPYERISKATTIFEWGSSPKPGGSTKGAGDAGTPSGPNRKATA